MKDFKGKKILITGGTGSFGKAVLDRFYESEIFSEIRIFSRDEQKQYNLMKDYNPDKVKFIIGNVRDRQAVYNVVRGVDLIFHAAALKQVPSCEFFPMEAMKTNVLGTENVLDAAIEHEVERVVVLSTDKAVYPINAMGISKAMMEKVVVAKARESEKTVICCTRYGNVMASRGSVIPLFVEQIKANRKITITDPEMTRFMMSLEEAVDLVLFALKHSHAGDILVQKSPATTIKLLADALQELLKSSVPIDTIGTRHGEKHYESLLTREEVIKAEDLGNYIRIPADPGTLDYSHYYSKGQQNISEVEDYHSHNARRLTLQELKEMLQSLPEIREMLSH